MKTSNKHYTRGFLALFLLFFATVSAAQNKVVIIPMAGDDLRTLYEIGKTGPAGGIVFHITDGGRHGLEASHEDQGVDHTWGGCLGSNILTIDDLDVSTPDSNTGAHNTQEINTIGCGITTAYSVVVNYTGPNGKTTGWYLPNREEQGFLYDQRAIVGGFADDGYWSSSEFNSNNAWGRDFGGGSPVTVTKDSLIRVRAIKSF